MRTSWHGFVVDDEGASTGDVLRAALEPKFSLEPDGRARELRRTWLDTFDWRLHAAGLTLEQVAGSGPRELTLTGPDGEEIVSGASRLRWPALASALPPGPLPTRLYPVTGVRALMPAAQAASVLRTWRVLNADRKTVARLTVDTMSVTGPGADSLPPRLTVTAVRGYQAQADRILHRLAAAPGLAPAPAPLEAALAAAGREPGDYTSGVDVPMTPEMPARSAMAAVLLALLGTMEANVAGTIADIDTEFLHDLRVCVRRTRSALKLAGDTLPDGLAAEFRGEFTWLGDATTPIRDLDVYLLNYPGMASRLVAAAPAELQPFHDYLARRRRGERRRLVRALRSPRFTSLTGGWRDALTALPPGGGPPAAALAADRIRAAHRKVMAKGTAITADSPSEHLHDLRKRCKELRYALEFFASLYDPVPHRQAVRRLKRLQDCLGTFQDCQVQRQEIHMFATRMMEEGSVPASALLAMGELAGQIAVRQGAAREAFEGRFAEFASRNTRDAFRALTTGARS